MDTEERAFYRGLGARISEARRQVPLTQAELAGMIGLSRTALANIEAGRQSVHAYLLTRLATLLGTPVPALLPPDPAPIAENLVGLERVSTGARDWARRIMRSPADTAEGGSS